MRRKIVAVIGAAEPSAEERRLAEAVGQGLARAGYVLLSGGMGGVMEAASRAAQSAGGLVVGILPVADADAGNAFLDLAIATGMGDARNAIITNSADAFVAVGGSYGTLSEIAFALKRRKPVIALSTWRLDAERMGDEPWIEVQDAEAAVAAICVRVPSG